MFHCESLIDLFHSLVMLLFVGAIQCVHAHPLSAVRRRNGPGPANHDSTELVQLRSTTPHLVPSLLLGRHVLRQGTDEGTGGG